MTTSPQPLVQTTAPESTSISDDNIRGTLAQSAQETPITSNDGNNIERSVTSRSSSSSDDDDCYNKSLELEELNQIHSEPDCDFDFEEASREHELLMSDLAEDNDDFARSNDEGWYYSDEN